MPEGLTRLTLLFAVHLAAVFFGAGCESDKRVTSEFSISNDEVVVILANGFGSITSTYGLTGHVGFEF
jgi:hypothetical protein